MINNVSCSKQKYLAGLAEAEFFSGDNAVIIFNRRELGGKIVDSIGDELIK